MDQPFLERRRNARVAPTPGVFELSLPIVASVQVADLSETGVLLSAAQPVAVGSRAQLRTRIGAEPVTLHLEVRRATGDSRPADAAYRIGGEFIALEEDNRKRLERLLRSEG